jgi:hypothetical protein
MPVVDGVVARVEMHPPDRMVIWAALGQSVGHLNPPWSQESIEAREGVIVSSGLLGGLLHRGGDHGSHWNSGLLRRCGIEGEVKEAVIEATPGGADS